MFVEFLRTHVVVSYILLILRLYVGWIWLSSGWGKITGEDPFSAEGFLMGAINNETVIDNYPTYHAFLENVVLPNSGAINILVPWGEFLVGLGLILGVLTTAAAFFGIVMNFSFMFAGVISSNPWMTLLTIFILVAGYNAGHVGGDRWIFASYRQKKLTNNTV